MTSSIISQDTSPKKVSLGVGAYRDDKGKVSRCLQCAYMAKRWCYDIVTSSSYSVGEPLLMLKLHSYYRTAFCP